MENVLTNKNELSRMMPRAFVFFYAVLYVRNILGHTYLESDIFSLVSYICSLFFVVKLILGKKTKKETFVVVLLIALGCAIYLETKSYLALLNIIIILSAKGVNRKQLFDCLAFVGIITACLIAILSALGAIENREVAGSFSYGFSNPNQAMSVISISLIMIVYVRIRNINIVHWYFLCLFTLGWAFLTGSRAMYLLLISMFLLNAIYRMGNGKKFFNCKWEYLFLLLTILIVILFCQFDSSVGIMAFLNNAMTGRLIQANYYYQLYDVNFFGNFIPELNGENHWPWYTIDCAYASLFIIYGLIYGIVYTYCMFRAIKIYRKKEDVGAVISLLLVAVYMLMENNAIGVVYCPLLLLFNIKQEHV